MKHHHFNELLRELMAEKDLSQAQLARCLGLNKGTVSKWTAPGSIITPKRENILNLRNCGFLTAELNQLLTTAGYVPLRRRETVPMPSFPELETYLCRVRDSQSILDFSIFQEGQERDFSSVSLDSFYIPLRLIGDGASITSTDLLSKQQHLNPHLVLLGDAGSGKTTILRYLTSTLAQAWLEKDTEFATLKDDFLLPLFVPLRYYHHFCRNSSPPRPLIWGSFLDFLPNYFQQQYGLSMTADFYQAMLTGGNCLLALDGFDEIPELESRRQMIDVMRDMASNSMTSHNKIILTSRVAAYGGFTQMGGKFQTLWVQNLKADERETQIKRWVSGLSPYTHRDLNAADILQRMPENSPLDKLAVTPMIVTTLCIVYFYNHQLPEQRAQLYRRCVDIMLYEKLRPDEPGQKLAGKPNFKRRLLARLAFEMHRAGKDDVNKEQAAHWLKDGFKNIDEADRIPAAYSFLNAVTARGTLLQERDGFFGFGSQHLTIREFLAGYHLILGLRPHERAEIWSNIILDDRWREPVRLAAGVTVFENTLTCEDFLAELLMLSNNTEAVPAVKLAGYKLAAEALWDLGQTGRALLEKDLQTKIIANLAVSLTDPAITTPKANLLTERVTAAYVLGRLGDPRVGISNLPPLLTKPLEGDFLYGDEKKMIKTAPFQSGVYPITNAQFAQFIEAGGYNEQELWSEEGWQWRHYHSNPPITKPEYWFNERFNNPNYPVVGVNWHEVQAFCWWLTATYRREYRLPTEEEWERLARGKQGLRYSWGDKWQAGITNSDESKIGHPCAVGIFPEGVSPVGAYDCMGNLWEWCSSIYKKGQPLRVLRGGSWDDYQYDVYCTKRYSGHPDNRYSIVGFRVVSPI